MLVECKKILQRYREKVLFVEPDRQSNLYGVLPYVPVLVKEVQTEQSEVLLGMIYTLGFEFPEAFEVKQSLPDELISLRIQWKQFLLGIDEQIDAAILHDAEQLVEKGKYGIAVLYASCVIALRPEVMLGWYFFALCCYELSEIQRLPLLSEMSVAVLEKGLTMGHEYGLMYELLGRIKYNRGEYLEAEVATQRAIELLNEEEEEVDAGRSNVLTQNLQLIQGWKGVDDAKRWIEAGAYDKALEKLQSLEKDNPDWWELHHTIAKCYHSMGNLDAALGYYQRSVELNSGNVEAYREMGQIDLLQGNYDSAEKMMQQAVKIEPDNPINIVFLAWVDFQQKKYDDARRRGILALQLSPGFVPAVELLERIEIECQRK